VAVKASFQVEFEAVEYVKVSLRIDFLFLMGTIKLAQAKHSILFHSPSSPHLKVIKGLLKNFSKNVSGSNNALEERNLG
jgi:hypothetical protein